MWLVELEAMPAPEPEELEFFRGFRWWTVDDVLASDETFAPRRLGALVHDLVDIGGIASLSAEVPDRPTASTAAVSTVRSRPGMVKP